MSDFEVRLRAVKEALVFGEAAAAAGVQGSSRAGWDCPACRAPNAVREREDHRGGRCGACSKGYDTVGIVMTAQALSAYRALAFLERFLSERVAKGGTEAPGLFDQSTEQGEANGRKE